MPKGTPKLVQSWLEERWAVGDLEQKSSFFDREAYKSTSEEENGDSEKYDNK